MQWNRLSIFFFLLKDVKKCFTIMVYGVYIDVEKCNLKQFNIRQQHKAWKKMKGYEYFRKALNIYIYIQYIYIYVHNDAHNES